MSETEKPIRKWLVRWQEFVGWLPLLALLGVAGWVVLGAAAGRDDLIRWLLELPILTAYALAATGIAYLVWRRWSIRISESEVCDFWARLMAGERGALIVYVVNAGFYLLAFLSLLAFFWPPR